MNYYQQWDGDELDSWQGKEFIPVQDDKEDMLKEHILRTERISYDSMYEYGLHWGLFL